MDPDLWDKIKTIHYAASRLPVVERRLYLEEACGGDSALRREIESLLSAHDDAGSFMQRPPVGESADAIEENAVGRRAGDSFGHYTILRILGKGGMGEVYLARDIKLNRKVALKFLPSEFTLNREMSRRFEQEAFAASALNHPNILTIYEIGEVENTAFIVSELIEGQTLREKLRAGPLTVAEALDIAAQTAAGLSAAHASGIVHRDIKPENIMIRDDGLVKVLDFGLAKVAIPDLHAESEAATRVQVKTALGVILGTAPYMSPEQARGTAVDARTDVWSLGIVIHEMLTARQPFAGETVSDTIAAILKNEPPSLSRHAPEIPKEFDRIVSRMLSKNAAKRYQHTKDLLFDLREVLKQLEFEANLERSRSPTKETTEAPAAHIDLSPTGAWEYFASSINNNRIAAAALVLLLLAIGTGSLYYFGSLRGVTNLESGNIPIDSVAVLPFENAAQDANTDYLSDGITESLINSLSRLSNLRVMSRSSVFRYKGTEQDVTKIGNELNVRAVLTGNVRHIGEQIVISVRLEDVRNNQHIWGEQYIRDLSDIVDMQGKIAEDVTHKLSLKLTRADEVQLAKRSTANPEAYQLYLRGRHFWNKRTPESLNKAIEYFQQAVAVDPVFASGYAGLADSYLYLHLFGDAPADDLLTKARNAANRALELDDSLAEAHASSGVIYRMVWQWPQAEDAFKRAVSLNQNYAPAHMWFSLYYRNKRQFDDAFTQILRARDLDPLSPVVGANLAYVYVLKNDPDAAIELCGKLLELDADAALTHELLGIAYLKKQRIAEATAAFTTSVELSGRESSRYLSSLGFAYAAGGHRSEAKEILKELERNYAKGSASGQNLAAVYCGLGDKDQAIAWLTKDLENRRILLPEINWRFAFEGLRDDPRFAEIVRRTGLDP